MFSRKPYHNDNNLKSNKLYEKGTSSQTTRRNAKSIQITEQKKQESKIKRMYKDNKLVQQQTNNSQQVYKMHYTPKLTSFMLADSNIQDNTQQNQSQSSQTQNNTNKNYKKQPNHQPMYIQKKDNMPNNSNNGQKNISLSSLSEDIRSIIQQFIFSIKDDQSMSAKLEYSLENLLLQMLKIASTLSTISKQQQTNPYSKNKYNKSNYQHPSIQINEKSTKSHKNMHINSCIRIQDNQLPKYAQEVKYRLSNRQMQRRNNINIRAQLPILCQDPSAQDLLSSCTKQQYYHSNIQQQSQIQNKSDKQQNLSNESEGCKYDYSNFVDNLFSKNNSDSNQVQQLIQNNSFLKNKYRFQHAPHHPTQHLPEYSNFKLQYQLQFQQQQQQQKQQQEQQQQESLQKQQSDAQVQSQSEVGMEQGASFSRINLCSYQARSNNYHSSYNFNKIKNNLNPLQQPPVRSILEQIRTLSSIGNEDKTQQIQNSISQYYIEQSSININKNNASKNISQIKYGHNHSPISYTYQQYSPISKSYKDSSHKNSHINPNKYHLNMNKKPTNNNKQNNIPHNHFKSYSNSKKQTEIHNITSPNSSLNTYHNINHNYNHHSKQRNKRYSEIYLNNKILTTNNNTNTNTNANVTKNDSKDNDKDKDKGKDKSVNHNNSQVTINSEGYIISHVLSRRKIF